MKSHVFHRTPEKPLVAVSAKGLEITDAEGRVYLDGSGGAAVSCIGHGDPRVIEAMTRQAMTVDYAHTGAFTSEPAEALAATLCAATTAPLDKAFIVGSGSEAVETAVKMARGYHLARGDTGRFRVIARRQSYHGNTLGALGRGGHAARREPFLPMLTEAHLVEPCFEYRHALPGETPEAYGRRAADSLEAEIQRLGPETVSAFLAETVVGATTGAVPPVPGYFARIREICDRHGVLLIVDEVMCGVHRCGPFFAFEAEGIAPDIVTLGKGLGGGYQPIAAAMCTAAVHDAFSAAGRSFVNGHTYMAHPVACAAALKVQEIIREEQLGGQVGVMGALLRQRMEKRFAGHDAVGDIRGRGLFHAIELVAHRDSKRPFPASDGMAARVFEAAKDNGLLVYPGSGTADGTLGDHVLVAPPYNVTAEQIDRIVDRLGAAVDRVTA
ncbi:hypothetical protein ATO6_14885 [Oceanicola sp. 22II-s10i]|uniref:aspartate aminotransferase family protein n=1 Tax=Oceanicola sp. 22II-s10i TaxID=1317116 RepID=UPI000B527372|nr:aspartate aminotransferase family protein [Oceanicola sp. 22II-s10i]OWU84366.1 hypothetical protein ATO6_14885 [Oceanicola sp. 22II-s10i]